jgi:hypothetical protein
VLPPLISLDNKQNEIPESIAFQKRAVEPVIVDVRREINKVSLVAKNTSFYPYTLKFRFNKIRNLLPDPDSMTFVLYPGIRVLMTFRIFEPSQNFDFNFKVDTKIGDAGTKPILDFPYLMPIGENRPVALLSENLNDTHDMEPVFVLKKGDTVHAMRKGLVTALPATAPAIERIASNSIEIRHMDGTIMVYEGIDPSTVFIQPGETVYPGEPLGTCRSSELFISLYRVEDEKLRKMAILFYVNQDSIVPFSGISNGEKVQHPPVIIGKEMNKKEFRKMKEK